MSAGRQGKTTNWQDDVFGTKQTEERQSQWGEIDGEIVSFDAAKQTATIKPLYTPKFNGKELPMPELMEVPVRFPTGGKGGVTYPIGAGDKVVLRPKMRSSENYHTGENDQASDARSFALSDMEAHLDGGESLTEPIQNFDGENVHLRFSEDGSFGMRGSKDGKIAIEGAEGNIYTLLAEAIRLIGNDQLQIAYGSSQGTGHALKNKAAILAIADKLDAMAL
ncbi:tail protein [Aminobacter phage Erebus]|nr:tail protein [Aminobacter phage Erebus]